MTAKKMIEKTIENYPEQPIINAPIVKVDASDELNKKLHDFVTEVLNVDVNYNILQKKVLELNELGVDITLKEIADIIESKFLGEPTQADLRRNDKGELFHPCYTVLRYPK